MTTFNLYHLFEGPISQPSHILGAESLTCILCLHACMLSCSVRLCATPWTVARQAPLSMGIFQARILEWVAMPSSWGSSRPKDQTQGSNLDCRQILSLLSHRGSLTHCGLGGRGGHSSARTSLFGIFMALVDVTLKGLVSGAEQNIQPLQQSQT